MYINVNQQLFNLLVFSITGAVIGILFDIFRILRKTFKTPDFVTYIEDILFWILTGMILLFTIFTFNNGQIRVYIFIGLILGFTLYLLTLSKYLIKLCVIVLSFIKKIIYTPINIIFKFTKKYIVRPIFDISRKIKVKIIKWIKNPVKKTANANFPNICQKNNE